MLTELEVSILILLGLPKNGCHFSEMLLDNCLIIPNLKVRGFLKYIAYHGHFDSNSEWAAFHNGHVAACANGDRGFIAAGSVSTFRIAECLSGAAASTAALVFSTAIFTLFAQRKTRYVSWGCP